MSITTPLGIQQWQRPTQTNEFQLCDPFSGRQMPLDPNCPLPVFLADPQSKRGLNWLADAASRPDFASWIGVTAFYTKQDTWRDGGLTGDIDETVRRSDVYLYALADEVTIEPYTVYPAGTFASRIQDILSRPSSPPSAPIAIQEGDSSRLIDARGEMAEMLEEIEDADPDDPLVVVGNLALANFDEWHQIATAGARLDDMCRQLGRRMFTHTDLRAVLSAHAVNTDMSRKLETFDGVGVLRSSLVSSQDMPGFMRDEFFAGVLRTCVIGGDQFDTSRFF
jgi:hypothetical protein